MKTAGVTTTINVPTVLSLYSELGPNVRWFVAGDLNTPIAAKEFCDALPNCRFITPAEQERWKSSSLIGFKTDSRRNFAVLEAVEWGADIIVSIDDDMIPSGGAFEMGETFSGLCAGVSGQWFDAGKFTVPSAKQRGLPVHYGFANAFEPAVRVPVGVHQGIILGVPDTDSLTAITNEPRIFSVTDVLRHGFVVRPDALTVFNSQLTAFRRELAPAFAQFYKWQGRNTDIFASMIMRRVMRDKGLYTYFGPPMAYHARKARPLFNDLKAEMYGLEHIVALSDELEAWKSSPDQSVANAVRFFYSSSKVMPYPVKEAAAAWIEDIASVL